MATEVGGVVIGGVPEVDDPNDQQTVDDFFNSLTGGNDISGEAPGSKDGVTVYTVEGGGKFSVLDENFTSPNFNLGAGGDATLNAGSDATITGGDGKNDILVMNDANYTLNTGGGNDTITSIGSGELTINAGAGNDIIDLSDGDGDDTVKGGGGKDTIFGGEGDDIIKAGKGADIIEGGEGNDNLTGGAGKDTFVFNNENTGLDVINDFSKGDILQIADRTGDGVVDENDYTITEGPGGNTIITLTGGGTITLVDVNAEDLKDEDGDGTFTL